MPKPKKLAIIAEKDCEICNAILEYFHNKNIVTELPTTIGSSDDYDLIAGIHKPVNAENAINIHASLLPAFNTNTPVLDAFMYGSKVTGITVHRPDGKIIFQYPLLIGSLTHFDELEKKITEIEKRIYPIIIEKMLNNEAFDFDDLFTPDKTACNHNCNRSGCGNCKNCQH